MTTYTTQEAMHRLGIPYPRNRSTFRKLHRQYPRYFVVVEIGGGKLPDGSPKQTLYDAAKIDELAALRDQLRNMRG
jgi:hypothetical protein